MPDAAIQREGAMISDRYRILGLLGGGAMARVYKVEHVSLGTVYALKEQRLTSEGEEGYLEAPMEAAQREARFLTTLNHASLPKVTDFFCESGCVYLVMDYVEGKNLKKLLEENMGQSLDIMTVIQWGIELCEVLNYLHSQTPSIIFRDVKPANIIRRTDNRICLVDFGIARQLRKGAPSDTIVFGSPGYAPPEQYGHGQTDPRSDIYALGATLHHLLTGRDPSLKPFHWPPVRQVNPMVPLVLERLVMRCLELDPNRRPESAEVVAKSLKTTQRMLEEAGGTGESMALPPLSEDAKAIVHETRTSTGELSVSIIDRQYAGVLTEQARTEAGSGKMSSLPAAVPATFAAPQDWASPEPDVPAPAMPTPERLFALLKTGSTALLIGCLLFALLLSANIYSPIPPAPVRPAPLHAAAPLEERNLYQRQQEQFTLEAARTERSRRIYAGFTPVRLLLALLTFSTLGFGVLQPRQPTRLGMIFAIAGTLCLICLTGAALLPGAPSLFVGLAVMECLLLIPATLLLATDLT